MFAAKAGKYIAPSGGGGILDSQIVGSGTFGDIGERFRGYYPALSVGTITDGTSNIYGGATILGIYHNEVDGYVNFVVSGSQPNSGWTTMQVEGGPSFSRSSATYFGSTNTTWRWTASNPFIVGLSRTCVFT